MVDLVSVLILVVFAGLGGIAGYLGRIAQKVEERRDEIYLKNLPGIYSSLTALKESLDLYSSGGALANLIESLGAASKALRETIFSSNILVFRGKLHDNLYKFFQEIAKLEEVVTSIKNSPHRADQEETFKRKLKQGGEYVIGSLTCKPKDIKDQTEKTSEIIKGRLSRYRSISWLLIIVVFVLGAFLSIIEIVKELFALS